MQQLVSVTHWLALLGAFVGGIELLNTRPDANGWISRRWIWLSFACLIVFFNTGSAP